MSHFVGLVICTPQYLKNHDLEKALAKYDENEEVPEYSKGEVSDADKVSFILYYYAKDIEDELRKKFYSHLCKKGVEMNYTEEEMQSSRFYARVAYDHENEFAEFFKTECPEIYAKFDEIYEEHGDDWNSNRWRVNALSGKLEEFSTYNPDSKWDWYSIGGRWDCALKTKSGKFVNECLLGEIDWTDFKPEDYQEEEKTSWLGRKYHELKEGITWHLTRKEPPFCLVVDGEWIEKGQMGWWAITSKENNEEDWNAEFFGVLDKLPADAEVTLVDFHI